MAVSARIEAARDVAAIVRDDLRPQAGAIDAGLYPEDVLRALGAAGAYAHHIDGTPAGLVAAVEAMALTATREAGGYRVRGRLPWVSNLAPGHAFAGIFSVPDGRRVMGLFEAGSDAVSIAANASFVALEGTGTYTVMIRDAFVPDADVIAHDAAAFVPKIRNCRSRNDWGRGGSDSL